MNKIAILLTGLLAAVYVQFAVAQTPVASPTVPAESFLGEQFCFDVDFSNSGAPGYGPYLRIELAAALSLDSADIFGAGTLTYVGDFPAAPGNQLDDPMIDQPVTGTPGASFYVLEYPVGSVVDGGPDLPAALCATIDPDATLGDPLDIAITPVYEFGDTPTGDNGSIVGGPVNETVTPTVMRFTKSDTAPESERTPGPSWPYSYNLTVDIANQATINPLVIGDELPADFQFNGNITITGGAGCTVTTQPSTSTPGGSLEVTCSGNTVGSAAADDVVVSYEGHIVDILDETVCTTVPVINDAVASGTYQPTSGPAIVLPPANDQTTVTARHLAVQKSVSPAAAMPGQSLSYTLDFQVTDFGDADSLIVTDLLPDGIDFVSHASLVVGGSTVAITPSVTANPDSSTTIVYDIGGAGGQIAAGTAVTLVYDAEVRSNYQDSGAPVLASDTLSNAVAADYSLAQGASACSDDSAATVTIDPVAVTKEIVNPQPEYLPGEDIVFRLTLDIPAGSTRNIRFEDYLPLPVIDVGDLDLSFPGSDLAYGPGDTAGLTPDAITISAAQNALFIDWPDVSSPSAQTIQIDLTAPINDTPFADGLFLTNILLASTNNTAGEAAIGTGPAGFQVGAPDMVVTKGVSATDGNGTISPAPGSLPIDGDISGVDGSDALTFVITAENQGGAPAYDVTITDVFPAGLTGCTITSVTDGTGTALGYSGTLATGLLLDDPLAANDGTPGAPYSTDTALITVDCQVAADIAPGTMLTNTAELDFASQSGATDFPTRRDDATVASANIAQQKYFVASSEPGTSDTSNPPRATIGEIVRYRLAVRIPEGEIAQMSLRDNLPSGLTFLDDGTATAAFISAGGTGLSSSTLAVPNLTGSAADPGTVASSAITFALPAGAISGSPFGNGSNPTFAFGDVVNANSDNAGAWLVVEFNALVNNAAAGNNASGANRRNNFTTFSGTTALDGNSNNVTVRVAEPALGVTKTASPNTGQAGDIISFSLDVTATSGANRSPAYDVHITDSLPAGLTNLMIVSITPSGGCSGVTDNTVGDNLDITVATMEPGCQIAIDFDAELEISVAPGTSIVNDAQATWTSLPGTGGTAPNPTGSTTPGAPGSDTGERDGSGSGMNTYVADDSAVVTIDSVVVSKVVSATSEPATGDDEHRPGVHDLAIGESATFAITVTIPHGTTPQVVITDTVPFTNGIMRLDSASVVSVGANLSADTPNPVPVIGDNQLGDGIDDTASFDFGQVVNSGSGALGADDQVVIQVTATLVDDTANANGDALTNTVLVQFGPGLDASASAPMDVVEPQLAIDKAGDITGGDAGDVVTYTVSIGHAAGSTADAHDLVLDDPLPAKLALIPGSLQVISGPAFDVDNSTGNTISLGWIELARGDEVVLEYQAELTVDVQPQEDLINTATLAWDSIAGASADQREYQGSDDHTITVTEPGMAKIIFDTSEPSTGSGQFGPEEDLTIGEEVTYRFTATFPEGTSDGVVITDQLPTGSSTLALLSSSVISVGANLSGASLPAVGAAGTHSDTNSDGHDDRARWQLDTIVNDPAGPSPGDDQITFEVVAVVVDLPANQSGVTNQLNRATLETASSAPITGSVGVDLVAPDVNLTKSITDPADGYVEAGDTVTVRLDIDHAAGSTADAFNLAITDSLPAGLNWGGDGSVGGNCASLVVDSSGAPNIVFTLPELALATGNCFITYEVVVDQSAEAGTDLTNSAAMDYYTLPDENADHNRRGDSAANAHVTVNGPGLTKIAQASGMMSIMSGGGIKALPNVSIGETVTYRLTIEFPEGVTTDAVLLDSLPASAADGYMQAIGASVVSIGGNLSTTNPGTPVITDASGDGIDDTVTFDFGDVTNTIDGVSDANDRLSVEIVALVVDDPANVDGVTLINLAELTYGIGGSMIDDAEVYVIEPDVALSKSMGPVSDGVVRIELTLENTGNAAAYNLAVEDVFDETVWNLGGYNPITVPAGFTLNLQAATPAPGQQTLTFATDPNATAPAGTLQSGASVTAVFEIPLAVLPPDPNPVENTADLVGGDSLPAGPSGPRDEARDLPPVSDSDQLGLPELALSKTAALQNDADGSGDVSPGDTLRYTLTLDNTGAAAASNIVIDDVPDANSALVVGSVVASTGSVTIGNTAGDTSVQVTIASLAAGDTAIIEYDTVIDSPLPAGVTEVINQAAFDSDELPPGPSDDPGEPGPDDPTRVPVNAAPDLSITKIAGGASTAPGSTLAYTLNYANNGNQDATGVEITEAVPANTSFNAAASDPAWSCTGTTPGSTCTLALGNLAAGGSSSAVFAVDVDSPLPAGVTEILNAVVIADDGSNGPDPTPGDNEDDETTPVDAAPDLTLSKSDGGASTVPGGSVVYTLSYENVGSQDATGVEITETVPANTSFDASASTAGWSCVPDSSAGSVCTLAIGALAAGDSGSAAFAVIVDDPVDASVTSIYNVARVDDDGSNGPDPTPGNNEDDESTPLTVTPQMAIDKALTNAPDPIEPGSALTYTITAFNTGNVTLQNVIISDPLITPTGGTSPCASVAPGGTCTLIGTYTVTQGDVDAGQIVNTATAGSDQTPDEDDTVTTPIEQNPGIGLVKQITSTGAPYGEGDTITYELVATNTGNVTLANVQIVDNDVAITSCTPAQPTSLAPGATLTCIAEHTVTQADLDAGTPFTNTATASGDDPAGNPVSADDSADAPLDTQAGIVLAKAVTSTGAPYGEGDTITYELIATNTGTVTLAGVEISDPDATISSCTPAQPATLAPTETLTCQAEHVVTQADLDAGTPFINTATASGEDPAGNPVEDQDSAEAPLDTDAGLMLAKTITSTGEPYAQGDTITYELIATNTGTVTLAGVGISDPDATISSCTPAQPATLAPTETLTCQAEHVVTPADLDAGTPFINTATASGDDPAGNPVEDQDSADAPLADQSGIVLVKSVTSSGPYDVGDTVTYEFEVTNTGGYRLENVEIDDPMLGGTISCTPDTLEPGESASCGPVDYVLTRNDVAAGRVENTATASGEDDGGDIVSDDDSVTISTVPPIPVPIDSLWMLLLLAGLVAGFGLWSVPLRSN